MLHVFSVYGEAAREAAGGGVLRAWHRTLKDRHKLGMAICIFVYGAAGRRDAALSLVIYSGGCDDGSCVAQGGGHSMLYREYR